jgi:hypothetical protein
MFFFPMSWKWSRNHCRAQARYEPPFLSPHRLQLSDWGPLMGAIETLIMRCAALESILESDEPLLHQAQLADTLGKLVP